jgi:N-acetylmuramoyl-L-alanine amidase
MRWRTVTLVALVMLGAVGCAPSVEGSRIDLPMHQLPPGVGSDARWVGSIDTNNPWYVRPLRRWKHIVIHHSATSVGNAGVFDRAHRARGWDELGYHFVITNGQGGPDGAVAIGSRWRSQKHGAHCGNTPANEYNEVGIGICLVGDFTDHLPTEAQTESLKKLVGFLIRTYAIDPGDVIGHQDAPGAHTECPGRMLHARLKEILREELGPR